MQKSYLMKAFSSSFVLLMMMISFLLPAQLKAQLYKHPIPGLVGVQGQQVVFGDSTKSRLVATIRKISNEEVAVTVGAIGPMVLDAVSFGIVYDSNIYTPKTAGADRGVQKLDSLRRHGFNVNLGNTKVLGGYTPGSWKAFQVQLDIHSDTNALVINTADFIPLYTVYFEIDPDAGFNDHFGILASDDYYCPSCPEKDQMFTPHWAFGGAVIAYSDNPYTATGIFSDYHKASKLFLYRSPSSVNTDTVREIGVFDAVFAGDYERGYLDTNRQLLDLSNGGNNGSNWRNNGVLLYDSIVRYGFLYTADTTIVAIDYTEYTNTIKITKENGTTTECEFLTVAQVDTDTAFICGNDTLYIIKAGTSSSDKLDSFSIKVEGLKPSTKYHVWTFAQYTFETSKPYAIVGEKETFTTLTDCVPAEIIADISPVKDTARCLNDGYFPTLSISAIGDTLTYQWFVGTSNVLFNGDTIIGATDSTYTPQTNLVGDHYYYCIVTGKCGIDTSSFSGKHTVTSPITVGSISEASRPTCGYSDGSLKVIVTPAGNYEYQLNGVGAFSPLPADGIISNLIAANYRVLVQEVGGGCRDISITLPLSNDSATIVIDSIRTEDAATCGTLGNMEAFLSNDTLNYKYSIDNGNNWLPLASSLNGSIFTKQFPVGDHTLLFQDSLGCTSAVGMFTIGAEDSGMDFTLSEDLQATCSGDNGLLGITVDANSTTTPTHYRLNSGLWQPIMGGVQVSVPAGEYVVELKDAIGCITSKKKLLIRATDTTFSATVIGNATTTCGLTNGTLTLDIQSQLSSSFKYSIDGGATYYSFAGSPYEITGLSAGYYDVQIRNSNGCVMNVYGAEVKQGSSSSVTVGTISVASQPTCGGSDGSLKVIVTPAGTYEYALNGSNTFQSLASDGIISNLSSGNYQVLVRSTNGGCEDVSQTLRLSDVSSTIVLDSLKTVDAATCSSNGSMTYYISGDITNYTYSTDGGQSWTAASGSPVTLQFSVGDHTLQLKDQGGCITAGGMFTIGAKTSGIAFTLSENTQASCTGNNGYLGITVTQGNPTHYRLNGGMWTAMNGSIQAFVPAGEYIVELKDASGCITAKDTQLIRVDTSVASNFRVTVDASASASCGVNNGTITLNITPNNATYLYSIDGGTTYYAFNGSPYEITGLTAGFYDIKVKNNSTGCEINVYSAEIKQGGGGVITGSISVVAQPTCGNSNGSIKLIVSGASSYQYALNGSSTYQTLAADGIISNLAAGNYTVSVQTANGCNALSYTLPLVSSDAAIMLASIKTDSANDCNVAGKVTFTVTGDTTDYYYQIDGGGFIYANQGTVKQTIGVGQHTLELQDRAGCVIPAGTFTIAAANSGMNFTLSENLRASCTGSNGLLGITVTQGNPTHYRLNDGMWVEMSNNAQISVPAGNYKVELQDIAGCITLAKTQDIRLDSNFSVSLQGSTITNCGFAALTLNITGTQPFAYSIDGGATYFTFSGAPYTITGLSAGIYDIKVRDAAGCVMEVHNAAVGQGAAGVVVGSIWVNAYPTCGNADGSIQLAVSGATDYEYVLNGGNNYQPLALDGIISGLTAGNYTVTVRVAGGGCSDISNTLQLNNNNAQILIVSKETTDAQYCYTTGKLTFTVTGDTTEYWYQIDNQPEVRVTNKSTVSNIAVGVGDHTIKIRSNGCINSGGSFTIGAITSGMNFTLAEVEKASCTGGNGKLGITVTLGNPTHYRLNGGAWIAMHGNIHVLVPAGNYSVELKDDGTNCLTVTKTQDIGVTSGLVVSLDTATDASCGSFNGTIKLAVNGGITPFAYSIDNGTTYTQLDNTNTITGLSTGVYDISVQDGNGCVANLFNVNVGRGVMDLLYPSATTPQNFCSSSQVMNLQASGVGIKWYAVSTGGTALPANQLLDSGMVYYAAQTVGVCESGVRTAVKVHIEPNMILSTPPISSPSFCSTGSLMLSDIPTDGNTNIVWFNQFTGGTQLPLSTPLVDGASYYAAYSAGSCQSVIRTEVTVTFVSNAPDSLVIASPQNFCYGALVGNLVVPHNKVEWYSAATNGTLIPQTQMLADGTTYYASYAAGACTTVVRTPVTVSITSPDKPEAPPVQNNCGGKTKLEDLTIKGGGIVWYDANMNELPSTTQMVAGVTYYAAQSTEGCMGDTLGISITDACRTIAGTVFPFVYTGRAANDNQYPVVVSLYNAPAHKDTANPLAFLKTQTPLYITRATYYNGAVDFIDSTPKEPGKVGLYTNPGRPIDWSLIDPQLSSSPAIYQMLTLSDRMPSALIPGERIGKYGFDNLSEGVYMIVIERPGFITRIGKITVTASTVSLGHRELVGGDVNGDNKVDATDAAAVNARWNVRLGQSNFDVRCDFNGSAIIDQPDKDVSINNNGATFKIYQETIQWINE